MDKKTYPQNNPNLQLKSTPMVTPINIDFIFINSQILPDWEEAKELVTMGLRNQDDECICNAYHSLLKVLLDLDTRQGNKPKLYSKLINKYIRVNHLIYSSNIGNGDKSLNFLLLFRKINTMIRNSEMFEKVYKEKTGAMLIPINDD